MTANVLIVEDEFLVALQLEDILIDGGYHVAATVSDWQAADRLTRAPDVALVDLNLCDGLTGPSVAMLLSERFGTQIIYVTANADQIGAPAPTALGVVHKPFAAATIERAIAYALDDTLTVARPADLQPLEGHRLRQSA